MARQHRSEDWAQEGGCCQGWGPRKRWAGRRLPPADVSGPSHAGSDPRGSDPRGAGSSRRGRTGREGCGHWAASDPEARGLAEAAACRGRGTRSRRRWVQELGSGPAPPSLLPALLSPHQCAGPGGTALGLQRETTSAPRLPAGTARLEPGLPSCLRFLPAPPLSTGPAPAPGSCSPLPAAGPRPQLSVHSALARIPGRQRAGPASAHSEGPARLPAPESC